MTRMTEYKQSIVKQKPGKRLALFDLDETILSGDSDYLWGLYLIENAKVEKQEYFKENLAFKQAYLNGKLDIAAYTKFSTRPLLQHPRAEMEALREKFTTKQLLPLLHPTMLALMEKHRSQGDYVMVVTATNRFVTESIVKKLPANELIATELEEIDGHFTGKILGTPSFRDGKVTRMEEWIAKHPEYNWDESFFYTDSCNDRFLLERVTYPIVINGDEELLRYARERDWTMLLLGGSDVTS